MEYESKIADVVCCVDRGVAITGYNELCFLCTSLITQCYCYTTRLNIQYWPASLDFVQILNNLL